MDLIGNRYAIEGLLGSGGMGSVYKARDTRTGGEVALKLLHPQYANKPAYVERFRREAEIAVRLDHPNVCAGLDKGDHMATPYIVMELLRGRSVAELVTELHHRFDTESALSVLVQSAAGLDSMLAVGGVVAHRDLSSANIFVGDDGNVKIADFGIAKLETGSETGTGSFLGNVNYMSPEQINDPKRVDARSDLYSLGIVLFEMLTGTRPFSGSPTEVASKHLRMEPPTPVLSGKHADLCARVLQGLLAKSPAERFQTPRALIDYVTAEMPEVRPVVSKRRIHVPWKSLATAALIVALLIVAIPRLESEAADRAYTPPSTDADAPVETGIDWGDPTFLTPSEVLPGQSFEVRIEGLPGDLDVRVSSKSSLAPLAQEYYELTLKEDGAYETLVTLAEGSTGQGLTLTVDATDAEGNEQNWSVYGIDVPRQTTIKTYSVAPARVNPNVRLNPVD